MLTFVTAHQKFIRQTPRKLRTVAADIRSLPVAKALVTLSYHDKLAARVIRQVLVQAQKNAINNSHLQPDSLSIHTVVVDEGPTFKRWQPVSRGRAHAILKRSSHLTITLKGQLQTTTSKPAKTKAKPKTKTI